MKLYAITQQEMYILKNEIYSIFILKWNEMTKENIEKHTIYAQISNLLIYIYDICMHACMHISHDTQHSIYIYIIQCI